jgi:hypothetical protein
MSTPDRDRSLEQFVDRTLRSLPPRKAPDELMTRVFIAIEKGATAAWWHRTFHNWPAAVKCVFLFVATGLAMLAIYAAALVPLRLDMSSLELNATSAATLFKTMTTLRSSVIGSLPSLWIYIGLAVVVAVYATALGIGAIAYRTLYASR